MVSIILPTFNRRHFLERAIRSVTSQTFPGWELLVVDDGSDDSSHRLVESFGDARIRYRYQHNQGVSSARNNGIRLARHPWICFLDSDDHWRPEKLRRQLDSVSGTPYQIAYTDEIWIRRGKRVNPRKIHRKHGGWIYHRCLPLCLISPSSIMVHRHVLESAGWFDESFPVCEDYELWLRLTSRWPVLLLEESLIIKEGGHPDQLSSSRWGLDRYRLRALLKTHRQGRLTPQQKCWTAREIARRSHILSVGFGNRGKAREAKTYRRMAENWSALSGSGQHASVGSG